MGENKTEMNQGSFGQMQGNSYSQQGMGQNSMNSGAEEKGHQGGKHHSEATMGANPYMHMQQPMQGMRPHMDGNAYSGNSGQAYGYNGMQQSGNPYYTQPQMLGQNPYQQGMYNQHSYPATQNSRSFLGNLSTDGFVKGTLIGAAATVLLTNESVQKVVMKTFAKGTQMFQTGVEEMKERFEDVKAEMEAEKDEA